MARNAKQKNRSELICSALRSAILERALMPGMKLPEDSLGERFGASRTIIRQALERLAAEGLVELRHNKGATVAMPSLEEARDLFELRAQTEDLVIARLAAGLTDEQALALDAHIALEDQASGRPEPQSIRLAAEFHILLAELTGSPVLIRYVRELSNRCGLTLSQFSRPHSTHCGIQEHRGILAALPARGRCAPRIAHRPQPPGFCLGTRAIWRWGQDPVFLSRRAGSAGPRVLTIRQG